MTKQRNRFTCQDCGHETTRWLGQCPACATWGSLVEELVAATQAPGLGVADPLAELAELAAIAGSMRDTPVPLVEVTASDVAHRPSGIGELDRVLGGGFVPGASMLIGGEPGIGKSTIVLQALHAMAGSGAGATMLVTAEESKEHVRLRAERLRALHPACFVAGEDSVAAIVAHMRSVRPRVVAVDSIQTVRDPRLSSAAGSVAQVRESSALLVDAAKDIGSTLVLVGHVTKDGNLAGPRVLEHLVDVVLSFEGDRHHSLRILRGVKNRFGPAGELGLFEMRESGLAEISDPGGVFLGDRRPDVSGCAVVPAVEGRRPLLTEVQALVAPSGGGVPRRVVSGVDSNRVTVVCGVLEKRFGLPLCGADVFVSAAGGVRIGDPAADLAVCMAIVSSIRADPVAPHTAFMGEVGLGGEVRAIPHLDRRVREAVRFGFALLVVPASAVKDARDAAGSGVEVLGVTDVAGAVDAMLWR